MSAIKSIINRSWRHITKELVDVPELSGKLTFPISVKQPGPRDYLLQCFIKSVQIHSNIPSLSQSK
ncbi:tubby F-box protein [Salix suchowensis]|nr:tubby F-box protein [Salix suchowensis]